MSIISRMLKQTAVYWAPAENDTGGVAVDDYGQPLYADPAELSCRWEDANEEFLSPDGQRRLSRAVVYVESDVRVGGLLMLGELADVTDSDNPRNNMDAHEIRAFFKAPNLRATEYLRKAVL